MVLGYSVIDTKVCREAGVRRKNSLKTVYLRMLCLNDHLEATSWRLFPMRKRAI